VHSSGATALPGTPLEDSGEVRPVGWWSSEQRTQLLTVLVRRNGRCTVREQLTVGGCVRSVV
jgi:hypothetical protein